MSFPVQRPRRLRRSEAIRRLVRETRLSPEQLIAPLFVCEGEGVRREIGSMPGCFQLSVDTLVEECRELAGLGVPGVILFGIPDEKDPDGHGAADPTGPVPRASDGRCAPQCPGLSLWADVCLCEYTDHGHCGRSAPRADGRVGRRQRRDAAAARRSAALAYARAGADVVAPSDMMDGRVGAIRARARRGRAATTSSSCRTRRSTRPASTARSARPPDRRRAFGDRRGYQMDPANAREALREVAADLDEGADIVMVKPALAYLDVIWRVKERFDVPVAAYNVSGEYAMVKAAGARGWLDEPRVDARDRCSSHPPRRRRHHPHLLREGGGAAARVERARCLSMAAELQADHDCRERGAVRPRAEQRDARRRQLAGARLPRRRRRAAVHRARRRRARLGRGRPRAHRLRRLVGSDDPRPRASGRRRGDRAAGSATGTRVRRADGARSRDGRSGRRARAVDRDGALRELGHRGDDGRAPAGARRDTDRAARHQVRGLLSRARRQLPREGGLGRRDVRHARQPRRHRRRPRATR